MQQQQEEQDQPQVVPVLQQQQQQQEQEPPSQEDDKGTYCATSHNMKGYEDYEEMKSPFNGVVLQQWSW